MYLGPSLEMLLVVAAVIALLLVWDARSKVIPANLMAWVMTGMVLIALAMLILLVGSPARTLEQAVRAFVLVEAVVALWLLDRRNAGAWRRGR